MFDFDMELGEVQEMASKFDGTLETFTYQKKSVEEKKSVAKLSFM